MPAVDKETAEFLTNQKRLQDQGKDKGKAKEPPFYPNNSKKTPQKSDR